MIQRARARWLSWTCRARSGSRGDRGRTARARSRSDPLLRQRRPGGVGRAWHVSDRSRLHPHRRAAGRQSRCDLHSSRHPCRGPALPQGFRGNFAPCHGAASLRRSTQRTHSRRSENSSTITVATWSTKAGILLRPGPAIEPWRLGAWWPTRSSRKERLHTRACPQLSQMRAAAR